MASSYYARIVAAKKPDGALSSGGSETAAILDVASTQHLSPRATPSFRCLVRAGNLIA
jgi:hypothetical protein